MYLFIFWLCWVFIAVHRRGKQELLSSCGTHASHGGCSSCCGEPGLGTWASAAAAHGLQHLQDTGSVVVAQAPLLRSV